MVHMDAKALRAQDNCHVFSQNHYGDTVTSAFAPCSQSSSEANHPIVCAPCAQAVYHTRYSSSGAWKSFTGLVELGSAVLE